MTPSGHRSARRRPRSRWRAGDSGTISSASLPGRPPSGPNSSPATRTSPDGIPRRAKLRKDAAGRVRLVGQPDLDVLGVARDARVRAGPPSARLPGPARPPRRARAGRPRPDGPRPRRGDRQSAPWAASHSGSGMRSIFRRFSRCETIRVSSPRRASSVTVASAAASRAASSADDAWRRSSRAQIRLRPPGTARSRGSRPAAGDPGPAGLAPSCPSTLPTCVPVITASSSPSPHSSSTSSRRRDASALRSGTAVPSQSKTTASKRWSSAGGRRPAARFRGSTALIGSAAPRPCAR